MKLYITIGLLITISSLVLLGCSPSFTETANTASYANITENSQNSQQHSSNLQSSDISATYENKSSGYDIEIGIIGSKINDLQFNHMDVRYTDYWDFCIWGDDDINPIYDLKLNGDEKNYYFYETYENLTTSKDGTIISYYAFQLQSLRMDLAEYLLLLGNIVFPDEAIINLLEYEPEIIETDDWATKYLRWETKNSYVIVESFWSQYVCELNDWKSCMPWSICIYTKEFS